MCGGAPCVKSVFGVSLERSVIIVGVIEIVLTVIATILNIISYTNRWGRDYDDCDKDVCIGPIIKYAVFDALFGFVCGLMLIFGAKTRNHCLLITWIVVTIFASFKYIWVVVYNDWSSFEVKNNLNKLNILITYLCLGLDLHHVLVVLHRGVRGGVLSDEGGEDQG